MTAEFGQIDQRTKNVMNGTKAANPKYSKKVGKGVDTTAQAAGIIAGRYIQYTANVYGGLQGDQGFFCNICRAVI